MDRSPVFPKTIAPLAYVTRLALAAVAIVGLVGAAAGQAQTSKDLVPWRGTLTEGSQTAVLIPTDPPIMSVQYTAKGKDSLLGDITDVGHYFLRLSANGIPLAVTDGVFTSTGANGDAIQGTFSGIVRPSQKAGFLAFEFSGFITGGKGRFAGATGHDITRGELEVATGKSVSSWEGMLSRPKP
jgi:hypothetical protein